MAALVVGASWVVAAGGCAALAGLDQTYYVLDDATFADAGGSADASADAATDADASADASSAADGGDAARGSDGGDAALPPFWSLDPSFGDGGTVTLGEETPGTLPVIAVDPGGTVRVAFAADMQQPPGVTVCTAPTAQDAGCGDSSITGYPVDFVSNQARTVLVTNAAPSGPGGVAATDLSGGASYASASSCAAVRGIALSEVASELQVFAYCGTPGVPTLVTFEPNGTLTFPAAFGPPVDVTGVLSLSLDDRTGHLWLAGCIGCSSGQTNATFFETSTGTSVVGGGQIGSATDILLATDVRAVTPGALVVGVYLSTEEGFFATAVPPGDDGGASLDVTYTPLLSLSGALTQEPAGHTRLVARPSAGADNVIVGSLHGQAELALANVTDEGHVSPGTEPLQTLSLSAADTSVYVGGAVRAGGALYVVFRADSPGGPVAALARLSPRQP